MSESKPTYEQQIEIYKRVAEMLKAQAQESSSEKTGTEPHPQSTPGARTSITLKVVSPESTDDDG